jgi:hypothetical protein
VVNSEVKHSSVEMAAFLATAGGPVCLIREAS